VRPEQPPWYLDRIMHRARIVVPQDRRRASLFETVESYVGGLLALLIAFELIVGGILLVAAPPSGNIHLPKYVSVPLLVVAMGMDGWLMGRVWQCVRDREFPLGLALGQLHPRLPLPLRPIAALGWLAHAGFMMVSAVAMHAAVDTMNSYRADVGATAGLLLLVFGLTFAANLYVVLAVSAVKKGSRLVALFWRWRILVDLALTLAPWAVQSMLGGASKLA
jgi:hypothetical protein